MNWRTLVLTGALAASLTLSLAPPASADPPPWAGVWRHKHDDRDWSDEDRERWRERREWRRRHRDEERRYEDYRRNDGYYGNGYYGGGNGRSRGDNTKDCGAIMDRMRNDQNKINEIGGSGRHKKALQWYRDDLNNAQRDMGRCRSGSIDEPYGNVYGSYDPRAYDPRSYDPRSYDPSSYDPYYGGSGDGSFDWKRDWPLIVGGMLNGRQ